MSQGAIWVANNPRSFKFRNTNQLMIITSWVFMWENKLMVLFHFTLEDKVSWSGITWKIFQVSWKMQPEKKMVESCSLTYDAHTKSPYSSWEANLLCSARKCITLLKENIILRPNFTSGCTRWGSEKSVWVGRHFPVCQHTQDDEGGQLWELRDGKQLLLSC